jgi:hypothetical protein
VIFYIKRLLYPGGASSHGTCISPECHGSSSQPSFPYHHSLGERQALLASWFSSDGSILVPVEGQHVVDGIVCEVKVYDV